MCVEYHTNAESDNCQVCHKYTDKRIVEILNDKFIDVYLDYMGNGLSSDEFASKFYDFLIKNDLQITGIVIIDDLPKLFNEHKFMEYDKFIESHMNLNINNLCEVKGKIHCLISARSLFKYVLQKSIGQFIRIFDDAKKNLSNDEYSDTKSVLLAIMNQ